MGKSHRREKTTYNDRATNNRRRERREDDLNLKQLASHYEDLPEYLTLLDENGCAEDLDELLDALEAERPTRA